MWLFKNMTRDLKVKLKNLEKQTLEMKEVFLNNLPIINEFENPAIILSRGSFGRRRL